MLTKIALAVAALMFMTPGLGLGADVLPRAQRPEDVGFSTERLARLTKITQEHVEAGRLPGAVILVARQGKIAYFESFGHRDRDRGLAMTPDALFRIYSPRQGSASDSGSRCGAMPASRARWASTGGPAMRGHCSGSIPWKSSSRST